MSNLSVIFPAYIYPTATAWEPLTSCIAQNPGNTFNVIINPANGPGVSTYPNSDYVTAIANLNNYSNVNTFGYVDTAYATRLLSFVDNDVNTYSGWSNYTGADIHMDGIFYDRAPQLQTAASTVFVQAINSAAKADNKLIYLNPGGAMDSSFYPYADYVNAVEVPGLLYTSSIVSAIPGADRSKSSAIVYGFLGTAADQAQVMYNFQNAGVGGVYVNTDPAFASFGSLWSNFCSALNTAAAMSLSSTSSSAASTASSTASAVSSSSAAAVATTSSAVKSSTTSSSTTSSVPSSSTTLSSTTLSTTTKASTTSTTTTSTTTKAGGGFGITIGGLTLPTLF